MLEPIAIIRCADYQQNAVDQAVNQALQLLGGIEKFVQPGQKVLLKVNLLSASPPEKAITTHPAVVEAVTRAVQSAHGVPLIGDSPGASVRYTESSLQRLYRITGMAGVAERTGAGLMLDTRSQEVPFPEGKLLKRLEIVQPALESDVIISLPKFKTHVLTTFTGATKNMFGVIPGAKKALLHVTPRSLSNFSEMLLDILQFIQPHLTIMDGIVGMEGNGPSGGKPRSVGVVLAGRDSVALDVIASHIAGIPPMHIPMLQHAIERGWWSGHLEDIPTLGTRLDEVTLNDFVPPRPNHHLDGAIGVPALDRFVTPTLVNWLAVKPVPKAERCTACETCLRACPCEAIVIHDGLAIVDYGRCIRCYCCHEMCPQNAIDLDQPWLARILAKK